MRTGLVVLALAVFLSPSPAAAQVGEQAVTGPIQRLLAQRAELNLTEEQVRRLEAIQAEMEEKDRPLVARITELRGAPLGEPLAMRSMPPEEWQRLYEKMPELQPLMTQLRENHWQAIAQAREVLTPEQNARLQTLISRGAVAGPGGAGWAGRGMIRGGRAVTPRGGRGGRGGWGGGPGRAGWSGAAWGPGAGGRGGGCPFWGVW